MLSNAKSVTIIEEIRVYTTIVRGVWGMLTQVGYRTSECFFLFSCMLKADM